MRTWMHAAGAALVCAAFAGLLLLPLQDDHVGAISNFVQLGAAVAAALGCVVATTRSTGHRRSAWIWLSLGMTSWACGQAVWTYYEVVLSQVVPSPSLGDIGFLGFPILATAGLVHWLGSQGHQLVARGRDLLDGTTIAASLLLISWVTALGSVARVGESDALTLVINLSYPVTDLVLASMVLIAVSRAGPRDRGPLGLLAVGLGLLTLADSTFAYLDATGSYAATDWFVLGWVAGFVFVAAAGLSTRSHREAAGDGVVVDARPSLIRIALPYVLPAVAVAALVAHMAGSPDDPGISLGLALVLMCTLLTRQFLAMVDYRRLLSDLGAARDQLLRQALHDDLTGLPNRVLFADRLDRALSDPGARVSVMFCDLDDFKAINDDLGHDVGDAYLIEIAGRLSGAVRHTDTVARLGGDEFAIIVESGEDAMQVAERAIAAVRDCDEVLGHPVRASISVGISEVRGSDALALITPSDASTAELFDDPGPETERRGPAGNSGGLRRSPVAGGAAGNSNRTALAAGLVRSADSAMYAAKSAGKGRAVRASWVRDPDSAAAAS